MVWLVDWAGRKLYTAKSWLCRLERRKERNSRRGILKRRRKFEGEYYSTLKMLDSGRIGRIGVGVS